ncbi:MAG: biotin transporter BioY [Oligoflexia bacterium]|nr:biotin transporter BioY [Oligoflexia bacterium]
MTNIATHTPITFSWPRPRTKAWAHKWEHKLVLAVFFSFLVALGVNIKIYLPFTPVPITLQTFFVLLSGMLLGTRWGGFSIALYLGMGTVFPESFFSGAGIATYGYLGGFFIYAILADKIYKKCQFYRTDQQKNCFANSNFVSFTIIPIARSTVLFLLVLLTVYLPGVWWLKFSLNLDYYSALQLGLFPFMLGEVIKIFAGVLLMQKLEQIPIINR